MKIRNLLLVFIAVTIHSYSQDLKKDKEVISKEIKINTEKTTSITVDLDKVINGIGPSGNYSFGIAYRDMISAEELKAYPKMKNIPDSLTNIKEYLYIFDRLQFYYQNYKQGIYSKAFFIKQIKGKADIKDTIFATDKIVKNTISLVSGYTPNKSIVYIVDTNNNGDYSDEVPKTLLSNLSDQDDIIDNAETVDIEYYDGTTIKKHKQLITVEKSMSSNELYSTLSLKFPQYRYGKIKLGNENYLILSESANNFGAASTIYLVKDQPYFTNIERKHRIKAGQYLKIGDDYIKYTPIARNNSKIKLTISSNELENKIIPISNQVGMIAPNISGVNILDEAKISLEKYKGKYVFVDFWSTNCAACLQEFPFIQGAFDKFNKNDIEIISVVDIRGKIDIQKFLKDKGVTWPTIDDKNPATSINGYNIKSFPTTYLIDPKGVIIATNLRGFDLNNKLEFLKIRKK